MEKSVTFKDNFEIENKSCDNAPLVKALRDYKNKPCTGFHIPGHNRGGAILPEFRDLIGDSALFLDTTDEFDNLGTLHPQSGAIEEAMRCASVAYNSKRTFFITSGSTVANLALAFGVICPEDEIIVARNSHRSVLAGTIISGARPNWIMPKKLSDWSIYGALEVEDIRAALKEKPNAKFVWVTNPTYEGIVSDIKEMVKICKEYNVPLIVDEAHGSLWNFNKHLPVTALELGADAVVHSLHKTGGGMTQASMLHLSHNSKIDIHKMEHSLKLLHTTSPSVLLLASLDAARAYLESPMGQEKIQNAIDNALYFRSEAQNIDGLSVLSKSDDIDNDITKIFIKMKNLSGKRLESVLEFDYNIEIESASDEGLLILSNIGNSREEFENLIFALKDISKKDYADISAFETDFEEKKYMPMIVPKTVMTPREAYFSPKELVKKADSVGRISAQVVALCPPGISVLLPGEIITAEHIPYLSDYTQIEVLKQIN